MKKLIFTSDFFYEEFSTGGAELTDYELMNQLESRGWEIEKVNTRHLSPTTVDFYGHEHVYIISNFMQLKLSTINHILNNDISYILYEHDHKYLVYRNPSIYKDYKAPHQHLLHLEFYKKAKKVICQSALQTHCLEINLENDNIHNAGCSLWPDDFFNFVEELECEKNGKAAILESSVDHKNQADAIAFCEAHKIPYDLISAPNPAELTATLSKYSALVFFPKLLETFCRVVAEAKMVGCEIITNARLGCASEDSFNLSSKEYIQHLKDKRTELVNVIEDLLNEYSATNKNTKQLDTSTHFKIVVPLYNAAPYIKMCVDSIKNQNYDNYKCVIIDDASTDNSWDILQEEVGNDDRFVLMKNKTNMGALANIVAGIDSLAPDDTDVIVNLDGDDWFSHPHVLSTLNLHYCNTGCWLTYGSHEERIPGQICKRSEFCKQPVPLEIIERNDFRNVRWLTSALRTFKYGLWKKIEQDDMKNAFGNYYEAAWDLAYMFPMLEMAATKIEFIEDILYVYNIHESNDHHVPEKRNRQLAYEQEIRSRRKYQPIDSL